MSKLSDAAKEIRDGIASRSINEISDSKSNLWKQAYQRFSDLDFKFATASKGSIYFVYMDIQSGDTKFRGPLFMKFDISSPSMCVAFTSLHPMRPDENWIEVAAQSVCNWDAAQCAEIWVEKSVWKDIATYLANTPDDTPVEKKPFAGKQSSDSYKEYLKSISPLN
jgi:hypothetical protein